MKLTGKVVKVESGSQFTDKRQRVLVRVKEARDSFNNSLELINEEGWSLDDEIEIFVFLKRAESEVLAEEVASMKETAHGLPI